jgi:hypothetical protein
MLIDIFSDRYEHVGTAEKQDAHAQGLWHRDQNTKAAGTDELFRVWRHHPSSPNPRPGCCGPKPGTVTTPSSSRPWRT